MNINESAFMDERFCRTPYILSVSTPSIYRQIKLRTTHLRVKAKERFNLKCVN